MKKIFTLLVGTGFLAGSSLMAQKPAENPETGVKNVIIMIPDGCSSELLAIGRWMQNSRPLNIDRYLRGFCKTACSDSPIGDSAPTGSTYATGHSSQDGFVATAPARSMTPDGRRFDIGPDSAYNPMFTLLEAARLQGKATGEVVTCFLSHATPADFLAHTPNRNEYYRIAKQMTAWPCDVFLGGGSNYVDSSMIRYGFDALANLEKNGVSYTRSFEEAQRMASDGQTKIWGLFAPEDLEFEIDRALDAERGEGPGKDQPDLEQMTRLAIDVLSQNKEGFFLMVEGSKIDWANHDNDLPASVFDFLAFDKAVGTVLDFAEKDGQTLVIVIPDHQCGGLSLGGANLHRGYAKASYDEIFGPLKSYRMSCDRAVRDMVQTLKNEGANDDFARVKNVLKESLSRDFSINNPTEEELDYAAGVIQRNGAKDSGVRVLCRFIDRYNGFGWTTYGHNGGDVFFSCYHPQGNGLSGVISNEDVAPYAASETGWGDLDSLSRVWYAPLGKVFPGKEIAVKNPGAKEKYDPEYVEVKNVVGKQSLILYPNSTRARLGKKEMELPGRIIYNGKGFYIPAFLPELLK